MHQKQFSRPPGLLCSATKASRDSCSPPGARDCFPRRPLRSFPLAPPAPPGGAPSTIHRRSCGLGGPLSHPNLSACHGMPGWQKRGALEQEGSMCACTKRPPGRKVRRIAENSGASLEHSGFCYQREPSSRQGWFSHDNARLLELLRFDPLLLPFELLPPKSDVLQNSDSGRCTYDCW